METAVLYRRVSTDHQDNSLEVQEVLNDEYAKRMGLEALPAFEDDDVSGSIPFLERTGGRALMNRLKLGDVKHLITAKQDRLGRDTLDTIATIRAVWEMGVIPHFTCEGGAFPRTSQNELLFEIKASVAQYERNLIRERTRTVLAHKFQRLELTGNVPYGYDCVYTFADGHTHVSDRALNPGEILELGHGSAVSKQLVDNPAEQATLREMAVLRESGWKYAAIAEHLNARGSRTKLGRFWQVGSVSSVLASRHTQRLLQTPAPAAAAA